MLNFTSTHPFEHKFAIIQNLVDRTICLSHESFYSGNFNLIREIVFLNHYLQDLIEKHTKIRIEQIESKQSNDVYVYGYTKGGL